MQYVQHTEITPAPAKLHKDAAAYQCINADTRKYRNDKVTDKELIRKVHNGNREALGMIADRYYDEIYRFCLYLTGQETDSYDITQEVFLRFIKYVDSYEYRNLKGYLLIIARNLCRDYFHHNKDWCSMEDNLCPGAEDTHLNNLLNRMVLQQALRKLPVAQREIVILRIYEGLKFHEIAAMLGCNLSTAKSRFRLGIKNLRKLLENAACKEETNRSQQNQTISEESDDER